MSLLEGESNIRNQNRFFRKDFILGVLGILFIGLLIFFYINRILKPLHGSKVKPPQGLEFAIKEHFASNIKNRSIVSLEYYYCDKFQLNDKLGSNPSYTVIVKLNPVSMINSDDLHNIKVVTDTDKQYKVYAIKETTNNEDSKTIDGWRLIPFNDSFEPNPDPCIR